MSDVKLPNDHPMIVAWNAYKASPRYENTRRWLAAGHVRGDESLVLGQLWAVFVVGWEANTTPAVINPEYTAAIGDAGSAYLKSVSPDGQYRLSGTFRWQVLWDALIAAARVPPT